MNPSFVVTNASFPAITICQDFKTSGYQTYVDQYISLEEANKLNETLFNVRQFGNTTITVKSYTNMYAYINGGMMKKWFEEHSPDYASPQMTSATTTINYMHRILFKKYNGELFKLTSYDLLDSIVACTFNLVHDCLNDSEIEVRNAHLLCFTFNGDGSKHVGSANAGLEIVLRKSLNETDGTVDGTDSFVVFIHEPKKPPNVGRDEIYLKPGHFTKIRVTRHLKTRQNHTADPCEQYSRERCLQKCIIDKCIMTQNNCQIFDESENKTQVPNLTGFDIDVCVMASLYAYGIDVKDINPFKVSTLPT